MRCLILSFLLLGLSAAESHTQSVNVNIIEGFKTGKTTRISPFLGPKIELITPQVEGAFNKSEAEKKLTAFFRLYPTTGFTIRHSGKSPSGSGYCIGVLNTDRGVFRVYLLFDGNSAEQINEIRIEKDE